jgi:two-component system chemotaxis response regulator CheB
MSKIRVLSVDDSALMRQIMTEIINSHSDMEMVATAPDPLVARDLIKKYNPDVLTLDVDAAHGWHRFPRKINAAAADAGGDGLLPDGKGSKSPCARWSWGRWILSPNRSSAFVGMLAYSEMIAEKIRTASRAKLAAHTPMAAPATLKAGPLLSSEKLLVIGASTGGTEAIRHVLQPLPPQVRVF